MSRILTSVVVTSSAPPLWGVKGVLIDYRDFRSTASFRLPVHQVSCFALYTWIQLSQLMVAQLVELSPRTRVQIPVGESCPGCICFVYHVSGRVILTT